jgi:hypothetical protein
MHEALMRTWPIALALLAATLGGCEGASGIAAAILLGVATLITACGRSERMAEPPPAAAGSEEDAPPLQAASSVSMEPTQPIEASLVVDASPTTAPAATPRVRVRRVDATEAPRPAFYGTLRGGPRWRGDKDEPR